ncbi:MAG: Gfo/Idh/MocA family oxidoreductase [Bacteroidota bacterium]|nr:Gfo/Idh/MocA family oxidoreductase [Bacteroidota bacterium]
MMNLGIIGAGGFSLYSIEAFLKSGDVNVAGVYDIDEQQSGNFYDKFGGKIYAGIDEMLNSVEINMIYISTPPYLHYKQSKAALLAGKHVICEKPAAFRADEALELVNLAADKKLLYTVNLMQRYNPLYKQVKCIIDEKLLGECVHGFFENYATDSGLDPSHWMWDETVSGGIFIEHAVHFFDLFEGWLGTGEVIAAQKLKRLHQDKEYWSRVQAIVKYPMGLVNFYHGFDQPGPLDRQELRLEFERGDITLYEWIPTKMRLYGLLSNAELNRLKEIFGDAEINHLESFEQNTRFRGRFKEHIADHEIQLMAGTDAQKFNRYQEMLTAMFADQLKWVANPDHHRTISGMNGYTSLKMAEKANQIAIKR